MKHNSAMPHSQRPQETTPQCHATHQTEEELSKLYGALGNTPWLLNEEPKVSQNDKHS